MPGAVSVIIPTLDRGGLLVEAVRSVLAASQPPAEVIVVDAGSTDGSVEAAAELGGSVRTIRGTFRNAAVSRNVGAAEAVGEYLGFLDSDDLLLPGKTTCLVDALAADPRSRVRARYDGGHRRAWRGVARGDGRSKRILREGAARGHVLRRARRLLRDVHLCDADAEERVRRGRRLRRVARRVRGLGSLSAPLARLASLVRRLPGGEVPRLVRERRLAAYRGVDDPSRREAPRRSPGSSPGRRFAQRVTASFASSRRRITSSSNGRPARSSALAAMRLAPRRALRDRDVRRPLCGRSCLRACCTRAAGAARVRVLFNLLDAGVGGGQQVALDIAPSSCGAVTAWEPWSSRPRVPRRRGFRRSVRRTHTARLVSLRSPGVWPGARIARRYDLVYSHTSVPGRDSRRPLRGACTAAPRRSPPRLPALQPSPRRFAGSSTFSTAPSTGMREPSRWRSTSPKRWSRPASLATASR